MRRARVVLNLNRQIFTNVNTIPLMSGIQQAMANPEYLLRSKFDVCSAYYYIVGSAPGAHATVVGTIRGSKKHARANRMDR